jgi:hypothetical protein
VPVVMLLSILGSCSLGCGFIACSVFAVLCSSVTRFKRCYGQMNYTKCKSNIQSARKCGRCSMDLYLAGHVAFHIFGGSETPNTRNNLK